MGINDDLFGNEWDEFESELIDEEFTEKAPKPKKKRSLFGLILFLVVIIVAGAFLLIYMNTEPVTEADRWLDDTKTVAIAYRSQLTAEEMDCVALADDSKFDIPDVPDWADPEKAESDDDKERYELIIAAQGKLTRARQQMVGFCADLDSQANANWPPNTIPLPFVDGAIVDVAIAETIGN